MSGRPAGYHIPESGTWDSLEQINRCLHCTLPPAFCCGSNNCHGIEDASKYVGDKNTKAELLLESIVYGIRKGLSTYRIAEELDYTPNHVRALIAKYNLKEVAANG